MTIFDKESESVINIEKKKDPNLKDEQVRDYMFYIDDETSNPSKMHLVILNKNQIISEHSHPSDTLNIISKGIVQLNDKIYKPGDWYVVKKNTKYSVKALENSSITI